MAVITGNAYEPTITGGPRIVTVYDNVSGCPPSTRGNPLLTATVTLQNTCYVRFMGSFIRNHSGRTDLYPYLDSTRLTYRLQWTSVGTWDQTVWDVGLTVSSGTHTLSVHAASPGLWGCGRYHGRLSVIVFGE